VPSVMTHGLFAVPYRASLLLQEIFNQWLNRWSLPP